MKVKGMATSATQRNIDEQLGINRERWLHVPTRRRYMLTLEVAGACYLEGLDMRTVEVSRQTLDNNEVWERIP